MCYTTTPTKTTTTTAAAVAVDAAAKMFQSQFESTPNNIHKHTNWLCKKASFVRACWILHLYARAVSKIYPTITNGLCNHLYWLSVGIKNNTWRTLCETDHICCLKFEKFRLILQLYRPTYYIFSLSYCTSEVALVHIQHTWYVSISIWIAMCP